MNGWWNDEFSRIPTFLTPLPAPKTDEIVAFSLPGTGWPGRGPLAGPSCWLRFRGRASSSTSGWILPADDEPDFRSRLKFCFLRKNLFTISCHFIKPKTYCQPSGLTKTSRMVALEQISSTNAFEGSVDVTNSRILPLGLGTFQNGLRKFLRVICYCFLARFFKPSLRLRLATTCRCFHRFAWGGV